MILKGKVHKFGDNSSGRYFYLRSNLGELAKHIFEDLDKNFAKKIKRKDFIVAGKNFGCGSSREHAPRVIKIFGVTCVIAKSFARIFYRNAINIGLPLIECGTDKIKNGDKLSIDFSKGIVKNLSANKKIKFRPPPEIMVNILKDGGLVKHIKKHGGFKL